MEDIEFMENVISHTGVLGMKWGKRKTKSERVEYTKARKSEQKELQKQYNKAVKDLYIHPIHSVTNQARLVKKNKTVFFDAKQYKELNDSVAADVAKNKEARLAKKSNKQAKNSDDYNNKMKLKNKKLSEMSNEELRTLTTRLQLEKQYKDLTKSDISPGKKFVSDILRDTAKELSKEMLKTGLKTGSSKVSDVLQEKIKK